MTILLKRYYLAFWQQNKNKENGRKVGYCGLQADGREFESLNAHATKEGLTVKSKSFFLFGDIQIRNHWSAVRQVCRF